MTTITELEQTLGRHADPEQAQNLQRFFKTGPGEYGEGDVFLGIKVPLLRKLARQARDLSLHDTQTLLQSTIHEHRFIALVLLIQRFEHGDVAARQTVFDCYTRHTRHINSWDLVDISAPHVVGRFLLDKPRDLLYRFAQSPDLWQRRIAIVATFTFIRHGEFADTLQLAEMLLADEHDLIHKACGWMLREVAKRDPAAAEAFLERHCRVMPRTMLRYAIERFPAEKRRYYMRREAPQVRSRLVGEGQL